MGLNLTLAPGIASVDPLPRTPNPAPLPTPVESVVENPNLSGDIYDALAMCESTMTNDTGDPYWGYFQFLPSTYASITGRTCVTCDSYAVQKQAAIALIARSGWGQFPHCAAQLGML